MRPPELCCGIPAKIKMAVVIGQIQAKVEMSSAVFPATGFASSAQHTTERF